MSKKEWSLSYHEDGSDWYEYELSKGDKTAWITVKEGTRPRKKTKGWAMLRLGDNDVEDVPNWASAERMAKKFLNYDGDDTDSWYFAHS